MQLRSMPNPTPSPHRRTAVRYRLSLPVIFCWNDGDEHTEGGFTLDVALDGVFIRSTKYPPLGADVRIEVLIPSPYQSGEELGIHCVGKVTRVLDMGRLTGFGVQGGFDDDHLIRKVHGESRVQAPRVTDISNQGK